MALFKKETYEDLLIKAMHFFMHRSPVFLYFILTGFISKLKAKRSKPQVKAQNRNNIQYPISNIAKQRFASFNQKHPFLSTGSSIFSYLLILGTISYFLISNFSASAAAWWNDDWHYRKQLVVNSAQVAGDLENFPMLVSLIDGDLAQNAQADGDDIVFTESQGNKLDHEIESFDSTTGALVAWVRIPNLDGDNDSTIYMYYGNPTADNQENKHGVWRNGYIGVWHFGDGSIFDSTLNHNDMTAFEQAAATSSGKLGGAFSFDGDGDYLQIDRAVTNEFPVYMSAWFNPSNTDDEMAVVSINNDWYYERGVRLLAGGGRAGDPLVARNYNGTQTEAETSNSFSANQWNFAYGKWPNLNERTAVLDADYANSETTGNPNGGDLDDQNITMIGATLALAAPIFEFSGDIDEVRIFNVDLSEDWISTEYNNQNSPSTFLTAGSQEKGPSPVLYLPFDEGFGTTAHDESSAHNDATISGASWADESMCKNGKCLQFDGNDYLEIDDDNTLDLTNEMTMEAWVKPTTTDKENQTIISKTETPTEPTKIYRSVGPSATSAITTGTTNAMTITGTTAKFASALPTNVGVGDAIQYDSDGDSDIDSSDSISFITARISNSEFRISNAAGAAPTAVANNTSWSLFRAYTSLANAEAGTENTGIDSDLRNFDTWSGGKDITSATGSNEQWNIACYANGTTADGVATDIYGWTTDEQSYIKIYTPTESNEVGITQRHSGVWDNNKYKMEVYDNYTTGGAIAVGVNYVRIDGVQILTDNPSLSTTVTGIRVGSGSGAADVRISNNIIQTDDPTYGGWGIEFNYVSSSTGKEARVWNNIIYDFIYGTNGLGGIRVRDEWEYGYVYNNTVMDSYNGIQVGTWGGTHYVLNNVVQNCTNNFIGTRLGSSTGYNITDESAQDAAFGSTHSTGTTDGATANKLIDSTATLLTDGVQIGSIVSDGSNYSYVTALDSETQLSINDDIFTSGESYTIYTNIYGNVTFRNEGADDFRLAYNDTTAIDKGTDLSADPDLAFVTDVEGDSRIDPTNHSLPTTNYYDVGADEYEPTRIYRSVGPGNTTALATGENNPMTITGTTVSFAEALDDQVGVGDAIQYDDDGDGDIDANDSIVFVSGRVTSYELLVTTASGAAPVEVDQDQDWSLFRAYTSLANAEAGTENTGIDSDLRNFDTFTTGRDLVANGEQWNIACYGDGVDTSAEVEIQDWTTAYNNYLRIYTPKNENEVGESQRHGGAWDTSKYILQPQAASSFGIDVKDQHVKIEGIQFDSRSSTYASIELQNSYGAGDRTFLEVSHNIMWGNSGTWSSGAFMRDADLDYGYVYDNIAYDWTGSSGNGFSLSDESSSEIFAYNNTIFNCRRGFSVNDASSNTVVKNNIIQDCVSDFENATSGSLNPLSTHNVTDNIPDADNAFGSTHSTGTATTDSTNHLVDTGATFQTDGVQVGSIVANTTDSTYSYVTAINSETDLTLNSDIFPDGTDNYNVYTNLYGSVTFKDEANDDYHLAGSDTIALAKGTDLSNDPYLPITTDIDGDQREGSYSIGADEGTPTKIYRSVGPSNTTALATGAGNDMTITPANGSGASGSTATFDEPLPDNIGVGDAIQYDDDGDGDIDANDSIVFITGRISNIQYSISNAAGGTPTAVTNDNDWSIFRAYTSLFNAEAGTENTGIDSDLRNFDTWSGGKDLTTSGEQWSIACYDDAVDVVGITIDGWTTSEDNYIKIYTPYLRSEVGESQRHDGKEHTGYYIQPTTNGGSYGIIDIREAFVWIEGIEIDGMDMDDSVYQAIGSRVGDGDGEIYLNGNIVHDNNSGMCFYIRGGSKTGMTYYISNNLAYNCYESGFYSSYDGFDAYFYNNTAYHNGYSSETVIDDGFTINDFGYISMVNNLAYDNDNSDFAVYADFSEANASGDTTGSSGLQNISPTFVDSVNNDFHLSTSDTAARGAGVNLYNDPNLPITTDIDSDSRPNPSTNYQLTTANLFDIGADQTISQETKSYSMSVANASPKIEFGDSQFSTGSYTLEPNQWNHLVYKRDSSNEYLFINGTQKDTGTVSNFLKTNSGKLYIGSQNNQADNSFQGFIDEVRIYNYARTAGEIKKDTAQGSAGKAAARAQEGIAVAIGGQDQGNLSDGLVAYYKMDEQSWSGTTNEVLDYSGNNNHGTAQGDATTAAGKFGSGGTFDGTGDWINLGTTSMGLTGNFTASAWVDASSLGTVKTIFTSGNTGDNYWYLNFGDNSRIQFSEDSVGAIYGDTSLVAGRWYHFTVVKDGDEGDNIKLYLDGVLDGGGNAGTVQESGIKSIGARYEGGSPSLAFNGQIDEVRVYNRALSANEVKQLYKWAPGPVAYLKMDEKEGTIAYDSSGNDNNGTMTNMDSATDWTMGKYGSGLDFDANNDYVTLGSADELDNITRKTITTWVNMRSGGEACGSIVSKISSNLENGFSFEICDYNGNDSIKYWHTFSGQDGYWQVPDGSHTFNQWVHLALTYDSSSASNVPQIYMDGIPMEITVNGSYSPTGDSIDDSSYDMWIGNTTNTEQTFDGIIDDVKIYNYIRTQDQIIEDMNAGHPVGGSPVGSQVAYWKFDEGVGATAYDSVGDNDGTLTPGTGGDNTSESEMWSLEGKVNKSGNFDKTDDYIDVGDNILGSDVSGQGSFSAWVKSDLTYYRSSQLDGIFTIDSGFGNHLSVYYSASGSARRFEFAYRGNYGDYQVLSSSKQFANDAEFQQWHFVQANWDFDNYEFSLTVDDVTDTSSATTNAYSTGTYNYYVGRSQNNSNNYWGGLIDEAKLYSTNLTEEQIRTEHNLGKAMIFGQDLGRDNNGTTVTGQAAEYCVPGDTAQCDAPIVELKMDEMSGTTAYDTSGNGNDGSLGAGTSQYYPTWNPLGKIGSALSFDGNDDYVEFGCAGCSVNMYPNTVSFWFNPDDLSGTGLQVLVSYPPSDVAIGFSGGDYLHIGPATYRRGADISLFEEGQWYHFEAVYNSASDMQLYINGVDRTVITDDYWNDDTYRIGMRNNSPFDGLIDDFKVYDYARTPAQVAWEYNRGKPIGWWKMDEASGTQVDDWSGNGNHGTMTNMDPATDRVAGQFGNVLDFDGSDDYVNVSGIDGSAFSSPFTISAWVKSSSIVDNYATIWCLETTGQQFNLFVSGYGPDISFEDAQTNLIGAQNVFDGEWHFVTVSVGSSTMKMYKDGILVDEDSFGAGSYSGGPFTIGVREWTSTNYFNGQIDDVRIYNYALTETQIKDVMNNGAAVSFR